MKRTDLRPFPEPREIPCLFGGPEFTYGDLSASGWQARLVAGLDGDPDLAFSFPYDAAAVESVKRLEGRYYEGETRRWIVPVDPCTIGELVRFMRQWRFVFNGEVVKVLRWAWTAMLKEAGR